MPQPELIYSTKCFWILSIFKVQIAKWVTKESWTVISGIKSHPRSDGADVFSVCGAALGHGPCEPWPSWTTNTNLNHAHPSCVCSLIPSGTHTQTKGISATSLNPVWGGAPTQDGGEGDGVLSDTSITPASGREAACIFPGKNWSLLWDLRGHNRSLFGLLIGCCCTKAEGGLWTAAGLLRLTSHQTCNSWQ